MNLVSILASTVKKSPDKIAVFYEGKRIKYRQLWENIKTIIQVLKTNGFKEGDKIAIFLPNSVEFVACFYAILMGGGIVIPLPAYLKQYELKTIFENCLPSLIITSPELYDQSTTGNMSALNVKSIPIIQLSSYEQWTNNNVEEKIESCIPCTPCTPCTPDTPASINYTYNGSGSLVGAELSHGNYLYGFSGLIRHLGLKQNDVFLAPLPMAHIYSLALGNLVPILSGASLVITDRYFPKSLFNLIETHHVTVLVGVPSLYQLMHRELTRRKTTVNSLRMLISGGEYMPLELHTSLQNSFNVPVVQGYGLTECLPLISNIPHGPNNPGSLGIPGRKDIYVKIVDADMLEMPMGKEGEILIKSPTTMKGYHHADPAINRAFYQGWLRTGDLGSLDDNGYLYFAGLKKKIYNISGLKVDPTELEAVGMLHPAVKNIKIYGETIAGMLPRTILTAEVTVKDNYQLDEKVLENFFKGQVAGYKVPKQIIIKQNNQNKFIQENEK